MRRSTGVRAVLAAALAAATLAAGAASAAGTHRRAALHWAPADRAAVHPGVSVTIAGVQCRAGYVLTDGRYVYLSLPASCTGVTDGQATDGCSAAQVPTGLPATVTGARYPGRFVYSSFTHMQKIGVTDPDECTYNSLSLVRLDPRDIARTNPSVPVVGGPSGLSGSAPTTGSVLTLFVTAPAQAAAVQNGNNGWTHTVFPDTAIMSFDVGAPALDASGRAVGLVSVIQQVPGTPAIVPDLARELSVLRQTAGFRHVHLARGTEAFNAG